jgi:hypothetical protein
VSVRYRGYIDPLIDAGRLLKRVEEHPSIERILIEEWLKPPYYRELKKVIVFETRPPEDIRKIHERMEFVGLGLRVNTYPGPV